MSNFLTIAFWFFISFMVSDYTLGRATLRDPLRVILATLFAILFVLIVGNLVMK